MTITATFNLTSATQGHLLLAGLTPNTTLNSGTVELVDSNQNTTVLMNLNPFQSQVDGSGVCDSFLTIPNSPAGTYTLRATLPDYGGQQVTSASFALQGGNTMSQTPSGEGTGRIGEARYVLTNSTGKQWSVIGTGPDDATALAEANAKLALTVGTVLSSTQRIGIPNGDQSAPHSATGEFEDAVITMAKTVNGRVVTRTVRLNNISTAYVRANSKGEIDGTNADVAAYVSAFRDGDGLGGYSFQSGHYTK